MRRLIYLLIVAYGMFICSCKSNDAASVHKDELERSDVYKDFVKLNLHLNEGIKSGRYNYNGRNKTYIKNKLENNFNMPEDSLINIYSQAGIHDAKDFVQTEKAINKDLKLLFKQFPDLQSMNSKEILDFLKPGSSKRNF